MFCLYSSCSPPAYLSLQRPMPLWAAPGVPPMGPGVQLGPGMPRGQPDLSEERGVETGSREGALLSHCRGKDGDGVSQGSSRSFFFLRGAGLPGKRRRFDSPGNSTIFSPPTQTPGLFFKVKCPSDLDSPFCEKSSTSYDRWETTTPPPTTRNHPVSKELRDEEQKEEEEEGVGDVEDEEEAGKFESTDRLQATNHAHSDVDKNGPTSDTPAVVMTTVAIGNKWTMTPPIDSPKRRPTDSVIHQRNRLPSPAAPSAPSLIPATAAKHGALKFGIDSILRLKDTTEASSHRTIQHPHLPSPHQHQHHPSLGPPPARSHPSLPNIHPSKSLVGSNFIITSPTVYSPHLYALQGPMHFPPPLPPGPLPSSSSSSSSSSASPASTHLIPSVLHQPPTLHYSLHHPFQISSRHSEFSGSTFGLLGSTPDLHSPHLYPHSKKKRSWSRAVFSNLQRKGLEKRFEVQKYVTKPDRRQLAAMLGLTDAQVKVWFQNRRMKWRHQEEAMKKKESDPRKPPSQSAPTPSRRSPASPDDNNTELSRIEPGCNSLHLQLSHSAAETDDEDSLPEDDSSARALLLTRDVADGLLTARDSVDGRIYAGDDAEDGSNRSNGIMSVVDILDLRKESVTCTVANNNDKGDNGDDDDDDEISVISASI